MPEQEDYLTKWMNPPQQPQAIQKPKATEKQPDYVSKWMGTEEVRPVPKGGKSDWKKELIGGLMLEATERSAGISSGKYIEPMKTRRYWIEAGKNASKGVSQFLQSITGMPGMDRRGQEDAQIAAIKARGGEKPSLGKVAGMIGKDVGKMAYEFGAYIPKIGIALAVDPVKEVKDNPVGVGVFVFSVVGAAGANIRAKVKAGKPVLKQDMAKAIESVPDSILSIKQKVKAKQALPKSLFDRFSSKDVPVEAYQPGNVPVQKILDALKTAKTYRIKQEALYTETRRERFPRALRALKEVKGRKGFEAAKKELKGEMQKVEFEPIVQKLSQRDIDALFNQVADSPGVMGIEKVAAGEGLAKLLGEKGGVVPTTSELQLLNRVFGEEFVKTVTGKRALWEKIKGGMLEGANVPRALMASYDLSFGLRQGIFLAARYPKEFAKAFGSQFKLFGSKKAFNALQENIRSRPTYELMTGGRRRLQLTDIDAGLSLREEAFMGAAWAEKIPLVGKGVRASNRAYTGFANKLRADVFDHLVKGAEKTGRNPWKDPKLVESIIDFVNAGSGRGSLKMLEGAAVNLNTVLFSPRLIASRLNLLNPRFYYKLDPFVRKQALQSLFAFAGMTSTVLGLAKLAGAEVETDMRSANWGKITIGNTSLDTMGGFQQYIRTAAQLITGEVKSTTTGKTTKLGEGYKASHRGTIVLRGLEYKLAPIASFAVGLIRGQGTFGGDLDVPEEVMKRLVPMVMQDVIDIAKDDPDFLPLAIPGFFGTGVQTYERNKKKGMVPY